MTNTPSNAELPFVSDREVKSLIDHLMRRQPEGESAEVSRLKLLDEFEDIKKHANIWSQINMEYLDEELKYVGGILTESMKVISGLQIHQQIMAGGGSPYYSRINDSGIAEFTQLPSRWQLHGEIKKINVKPFNYDLTPIQTQAVPQSLRLVPFLELEQVFFLGEEHGEVIDNPYGYATISLPLDDNALDLRQSIVRHESHKANLKL